MGTVTDDAEGDVTVTTDASAIDDRAIHAAMVRQTGEIQQVPAAVSAIKVNGRRAYAKVRAGEDVVLRPRTVTVSRFEAIAIRRHGQVIDADASTTQGGEMSPDSKIRTDVTSQRPHVGSRGARNLDVGVNYLTVTSNSNSLKPRNGDSARP